jgi:GGDEF domain-containing protein
MLNQSRRSSVPRRLEVVSSHARDGATRPIALDEVRRTTDDVVNDPERLSALYRLGVLDTAPDDMFRSLVRLERRSFGVQVARIHFLDEARQWVYAGTDGSECSSIPVHQSVCQYVIRQDRPLVIPDLTAQPGLCRFVIDGETMRFYASVPLVAGDGHAVGALCLLDPGPRESLAPSEIGLFQSTATVIAQALEQRESANGGADDHSAHSLTRDAVTGLPSRRGLMLRLQRQLDTHNPHDWVTGVLTIHLRGLDRLTNAYGVAAVNELRREIGARLSADLKPGEVLAHPDESRLVLISPLQGQSGPEAEGWLTVRGKELIARLGSQAFHVVGQDFSPEIGIGLARAPLDGVDASELLALADKAAARSAQGAIWRPLRGQSATPR